MSLVERGFLCLLVLSSMGSVIGPRSIRERRERAARIVTEFIPLPDMIPAGLKNPSSPRNSFGPPVPYVEPRETAWLTAAIRARVTDPPRCFAVEADVEKRAVLVRTTRAQMGEVRQALEEIRRERR